MAGELASLIGRNIKAAREARGWKQRELASAIAQRDTAVANPREAAISNTAVSEWERGVRKPGDRYMPLIVEVLEKPTEWFYTDHEADALPKPTPDPFSPVEENEHDHDSVLIERLERLESSIEALNQKLNRMLPDPDKGPVTLEQAVDAVLDGVQAQRNISQVQVRMLEEVIGKSGRDIGLRDLQARLAKDRPAEPREEVA